MEAKRENNHSEQGRPSYDAIISGAGPVGLFLACELALARCTVLILEKTENLDSPLKKNPFGIRGLSAPTIEALYRRNLLHKLELHKRIKSPHQNTGQENRRQVGHFAGIPFHDEDIDVSQWQYRLPNSTEASLISEMKELETVLSERAKALGVEIIRGLTVTGFQQAADEVFVEADNLTFRAKWLVGCDGSRSIVRKAGSFKFEGTEPAFTGYSTLVDIADPEKLKPGRNLTPTGMYLQSRPGYLHIQDFDGGAFHGSEKELTLEHVQEVLRRVSNTDVTLSALHLATTWTDRARQATAYRNGRILLAGDAAHIHAPLGGQGLNLGLGDAMNLGWKLAAIIHGQAPDGLLDSYYAERYPVGAQVLDWSRAQAAIMGQEPYARALNAIFRDLMNTRDGATYFAGRVWGVNLHYDLAGEHPLIGRSVPDFKFDDGSEIGALMHDGKGILLDFSKNSVLENWTAGYHDQIKYIAGHAKDQLGLKAILVRPDGIIAWASDSPADLNELQKAAVRWFLDPDLVSNSR